jgi:hypothetical protein
MAGEMVRAVLSGKKTVTRRLVHARDVSGMDGLNVRSMTSSVAFGTAGDRLYVRESFAPRYFDGGAPAYMADWDPRSADLAPEPKWTPSIHMPRAAARIFLDVTSVRVERLQDITEEDALAEGIRTFTKDDVVLKYWPCDPTDGALKCRWSELPRTAKAAFVVLWDSLAAKGAKWADNPWTWRVEFAPSAAPQIGGQQ